MDLKIYVWETKFLCEDGDGSLTIDEKLHIIVL